MATLKTRDIRTNLSKKGFEEENNRDHIWLFFRTPDGKKTAIRTKLSHGKAEIDDYLIAKMAKQTQLNKSQFIELVSCTLSGEKYLELVKDKM